MTSIQPQRLDSLYYIKLESDPNHQSESLAFFVYTSAFLIIILVTWIIKLCDSYYDEDCVVVTYKEGCHCWYEYYKIETNRQDEVIKEMEEYGIFKYLKDKCGFRISTKRDVEIISIDKYEKRIS